MAGESAREAARRRREKAARLLRSAELYERGAEGEAETKKALSALPLNGWTVIHDVPWPGRRYANLDHVVVGPPGVFVIDSKNWSGRVTVDGGVLRQNGHRRDPALESARDAVLSVQHVLVGAEPLVHPVLCFVRDEPLTGWLDRVFVCSTANLTTFLLSRPQVLAPAEVESLATRLSSRLVRGGTDPAAEIPAAKAVATPRTAIDRLMASSRVEPAAASGQKRRTRKGAVVLSRLAVAGVLIGVLATAPQVVTGASQAFADLMVSIAED